MTLRFKIDTKYSHLSAVAGVMLSALLTFGTPALAQSYFNASAPEKFDGHAWNNLTLDQSTTEGIKNAFRTSKGAYRPEGMVLAQSGSSQVNVQVLMDGRGKDSRLIGFRLFYRDVGADVNALSKSLGEQPETVYPRQRFSNWHIQIFPRSGIAACVVKEGVGETVPLLVLTTPERVKRLVRGFSDKPTPIGDLKTQFNPNDVKILFGPVIIDHEQNGLKMLNADTIDALIRDQAIANPGSSHLRYSSGGTGDYRVQVVLDKPKFKEGKYSVGVFATGEAPFGHISASGFSSGTFDRDLFGDVNVNQDVILQAFRQARDLMERDFTEQVRKGLPSSPKAYREQIWNALTDAAIR